MIPLDDLKPGMFVIARETRNAPAPFTDPMLAYIEAMERRERKSIETGVPMRIVEVCLPFILVEFPEQRMIASEGPFSFSSYISTGPGAKPSAESRTVKRMAIDAASVDLYRCTRKFAEAFFPTQGKART